MRGKTAEGRFAEPFDPRVITFDNYTEANAWHYTFFVPHDVRWPGKTGQPDKV
jgi:putative alpha-1,2-mannosidase